MKKFNYTDWVTKNKYGKTLKEESDWDKSMGQVNNDISKNFWKDKEKKENEEPTTQDIQDAGMDDLKIGAKVKYEGKPALITQRIENSDGSVSYNLDYWESYSDFFSKPREGKKEQKIPSTDDKLSRQGIGKTVRGKLPGPRLEGGKSLNEELDANKIKDSLKNLAKEKDLPGFGPTTTVDDDVRSTLVGIILPSLEKANAPEELIKNLEILSNKYNTDQGVSLAQQPDEVKNAITYLTGDEAQKSVDQIGDIAGGHADALKPGTEKIYTADAFPDGLKDSDFYKKAVEDGWKFITKNSLTPDQEKIAKSLPTKSDGTPLKEKIQELSLDQKAKLYFMGLVRKGVIDTLPEDPKAAYVRDMMDKEDPKMDPAIRSDFDDPVFENDEDKEEELPKEFDPFDKTDLPSLGKRIPGAGFAKRGKGISTKGWKEFTEDKEGEEEEEKRYTLKPLDPKKMKDYGLGKRIPGAGFAKRGKDISTKWEKQWENKEKSLKETATQLGYLNEVDGMEGGNMSVSRDNKFDHSKFDFQEKVTKASFAYNEKNQRFYSLTLSTSDNRQIKLKYSEANSWLKDTLEYIHEGDLIPKHYGSGLEDLDLIVDRLKELGIEASHNEYDYS
jgi:hypothetical protein